LLPLDDSGREYAAARTIKCYGECRCGRVLWPRGQARWDGPARWLPDQAAADGGITQPRSSALVPANMSGSRLPSRRRRGRWVAQAVGSGTFLVGRAARRLRVALHEHAAGSCRERLWNLVDELDCAGRFTILIVQLAITSSAPEGRPRPAMKRRDHWEPTFSSAPFS
jgi:hypothetical protein